MAEEIVISEGKSRLSVHLEGGRICLEQTCVGAAEPAVVRIEPGDVSAVVYVLKGFEQRLHNQSKG